MKIFILSNSFVAATLINNIEYLLGLNLDSIILLEENHNIYENNVRNIVGIKVELYESAEVAVKHSNLALLFNVKEKTILQMNNIYKLCYLYEKKFHTIDLTDLNNQIYCDREDKIRQPLNFKSVPVVLLLSIGRYHQQYVSEIMIHKILKNQGVNFYQIFSQQSSYLLKQISSSVNIKVSAIAHEFNPYNIIVMSLSYKNIEEISLDQNMCKLFTQISPNFLIINTESNFQFVDYLKNIIAYRCSVDVDMFIMSNYIDIGSEHNGRPLYHENIHNNVNGVYCNTDTEIEKLLQLKLLSKIAFPKGVVIY